MTKDIDPLVERVARAMCIAEGREPQSYAGVHDGLDRYAWEMKVPEARAAIAAVLEWYSDPKNITFKMIEEFAYFDGDDDYDVSRATAAAMAAELKRRQG